MSVSIPPLHACRTCEHGRDLHRECDSRPFCTAHHQPVYHLPEHEHDDQHGFHRHCESFVMRAEIIDADEEDA